MDQKSKVKRFLGLLRTAQNSAFVSLVCDNLRVELQQKPWKALKILEFVMKEAPKANSDFTRLKLAEGLIPLLGESLSDSSFVESILWHGKSKPKDLQKLLSSCMVIESVESDVDRVYFTFTELMKSKKTFFPELLEHYQPLLADLVIQETDSSSDKGGKSSKDSIKQMFMEGTLGGKVKTDRLKLSDFIDESFFEEIGEIGGSGEIMKSISQLKELKDLVQDLKKQIGNKVLMSEGHVMATKRQKTASDGVGSVVESRHQLIVMSPLLAIVMSVITNNSLVENDWKVRQASANVVRIALQQLSTSNAFTYHLVSRSTQIETGSTEDGEFKVVKSCMVPASDVVQALLPQIFIVLMKDHFNDFEELKVLTPVREEAVNLLVYILDNKLCPQEEVDTLLASLPNLLKSIDNTPGSSDNWITKYNFFLLVKALFSTKSQHESMIKLRHNIFHMFSRVLIESLLHLEDEVRIIVTDIISMILPIHMAQPEYLKTIAYLLQNLSKMLQQSDEVESSAISVFALINKIIDTLPVELERVNFVFNVDIFCPFNFHKITNVRYSYLQIVKKCLSQEQISVFPNQELDLGTLLRLTLQSLAMERMKPLVKLNIENLNLIVKLFMQFHVGYLHLIESLFTNQMPLPVLLYSFEIASFESFIIFESKNFESIERNYYKIVVKPVSPEEISQFYQGKVKNMAKALSIMMQHSPDACGLILNRLEAYMVVPPENMPQGEQAPVHEAHMLYLMSVYNLMMSQQATVINLEYVHGISSKFISEFQEEQVSINHFQDLSRLQTVMNLFYEIINRNSGQQHLLQGLQPLFAILETSAITYKVPNLGNLHFLLDSLGGQLAPLQETHSDILDCFNEMRGLFQKMTDYANVTCTRIKQISAGIQVLLALDSLKRQPTQLPQLTNQLNNLIKPILNQVKKESSKHIQSLACHSCVQLITLLLKLQKVKPAQQILQLIMKDVEAIKYPGGSGSSVQDRGVETVFKSIVKLEASNILLAFNQYVLNYLLQSQQQLEQSLISLPRVLNFLLTSISSNQSKEASLVYREEVRLLTVLTCSLIEKVHLIESESDRGQELPNVSSLIFRLFPSAQSQIIAVVVNQMEVKSRSAFEVLSRLLDDVQAFNNEQISTQTMAAGHDFLRFIPIFIIPVIQNIQYSREIFGNDKQITLILAQLLSLLPLNLASLHQKQAVPEKKMLVIEEESKSGDVVMQVPSSDLEGQAQAGFNFLQIFVNNQLGAESYQLQIKVKANLRDYQRQGITWLASLGKYNLNCALCDDMGLGKTLQALCVVLNESYLHKLKTKVAPLSLIVCPTTITYNWSAEVKRYFDGVRVAIYEGSSQERQKIIKNHDKYDLIIVSYDKLRNDVKQFTELHFLYVILDEAHIIKNSKAKTTQAVKSLKCEKKMVLTGTPLQNKVSELWSIFDFLMPGFLEEEGVFNKKYNQYLTSNIKKLSEKLEETQQFIHALKSLKKRISPFILRRTKEQVLKELPPKIIQDVVCKMSSFQEYVHQQVSKYYPIDQTIQQSKSEGSGKDQQLGGKKPATQGRHVLQSLIMHRKVCNHPMFVAQDFVDKYGDKNIVAHFGKKPEKELLSYEQSGKLMGLVEKLVECEIISQGAVGADGASESKGEHQDKSFMQLAESAITTDSKATHPHRALIFCQMGSFLQMIVDQVLTRFNVKHEQLLSKHEARERLEIVDRFNHDESIKVLILTTAVGGLGLTLTGADTVIFVEHDWNPMKDLQAIDRAHRIGQTRQVCVYRLIMQDTIEEKIMNLQRFKENLARSLIQSKETSVDSNEAAGMELTDLLNSFQDHSAFNDQGKKPKQTGTIQVEDKLISGIEEIWKGGAFSTEDL